MTSAQAAGDDEHQDDEHTPMHHDRPGQAGAEVVVPLRSRRNAVVPDEVRDRAPTGPALYLAARLYGMTGPGRRPPWPSQATLMRYLGLWPEGEPEPEPRAVRKVTTTLRRAGLVETFRVHPRASLRYVLTVQPPRVGDGVPFCRVPWQFFDLVEDPDSPIRPGHILTWLYLDAALGGAGWTTDTAHELAQRAQKARPGLPAFSEHTARRHVGHFAAAGLVDRVDRPGIGWVLARPGRLSAALRPRPKSSGHPGQKVPVTVAKKFRSPRPKSSGPELPPRELPPEEVAPEEVVAPHQQDVHVVGGSSPSKNGGEGSFEDDQERPVLAHLAAIEAKLPRGLAIEDGRRGEVLVELRSLAARGFSRSEIVQAATEKSFDGARSIGATIRSRLSQRALESCGQERAEAHWASERRPGGGVPAQPADPASVAEYKAAALRSIRANKRRPSGGPL